MFRVCAGPAALLAACAMAVPAWAGAFTLEPGEAKLFVTGMAGGGDRFFDRDGKRRPRGKYSKRELQAYAEYGALDGVTLVGSAAFQHVKTGGPDSETRKGFGRSEIGARFRLFQQNGWIVSAQGSAVIAGAKENDRLAVVGESDDQFDGRALVAYSFQAFEMPAFVDVAAGYRMRTGNPADEVRVDATFGLRPVERLLLLAQSFNTIGTKRWDGPFALKQRIHKLQGGAMFDVTASISLIASAFFTVDARDALDERGATLGLGFRF